MLDIDFIKELNKRSLSLGYSLGDLEQVSLKNIPNSTKTQAKGIRFICKFVYESTDRYLWSITDNEQAGRSYYTEADLLSDLLVAGYLFNAVCGTSFHYYEKVLDACEEYSVDCNAWETFHKLKEELERVQLLTMI